MPTAKRPQIILLAILPSVAIGLLNGLYPDELPRDHPGWYWMADITQFILVPAIAVVVLHFFSGCRPREYGFQPILRDNKVHLAVGLILFVTFIYWLAYEPVKAVAYRFFWSTASSPVFDAALPTGQPLRILTLLYICITAAVVEEPVFRSLPWLYFSSTMKFPTIPYLLTTTLLFSAIHWEHGVPNLVANATLGLAAGALYTRVQNVWPFIWAHFLTGAWSYRWM